MPKFLNGNDKTGKQTPLSPAFSRDKVFYRGSSMAPVFQTGDRMRVVSCDEAELRRGDIIVFKPPGEDRSSLEDPWVLKGEHIRGRVVSFERGEKSHAVRGRIAGLLHAAAMRGMQRPDRCLSNILHSLYHRLSQMGVFRRLLPISVAPRIVTFGRPDGTDMQILMGRQVIGRCVAGTGWVIKRPYRLFVDERSLPDCAGRPCQSLDGR